MSQRDDMVSLWVLERLDARMARIKNPEPGWDEYEWLKGYASALLAVEEQTEPHHYDQAIRYILERLGL